MNLTPDTTFKVPAVARLATLLAVLLLSPLLVFAAPEPAPALTAEIRQAEKPGSILANHFEICLRNTGTNTLFILKPLDGSLWSWMLPFYRFAVSDTKGRKLGMPQRFKFGGLWGGTRWPDDYLVKLLPGESFSTVLDLCYPIPEDGEYDVLFEYVMDTAQDPNRGVLLTYPPEAWNGKAASRPIRILLRKQPM